MSRTAVILDTSYHILYALIHSFISLILFVYNYLYKKFKAKQLNENDLKQCIQRLDKVPKHMAICINEEPINYHCLVQMIHWCQQFGVRYVSLFTSNDQSVSYQKLEKLLRNRTTSSVTNGHKPIDGLRHRINGCNNNTTISGKANRYMSLDGLDICFLTHEDSHQSIVNAAKHLCLKTEPIEQKDISAHLRKSFDFPDPDVMLSFGRSTTLYGYPIWQIRLTEIYFLPTHLDFRWHDFWEVLRKYSKCEQRLGK